MNWNVGFNYCWYEDYHFDKIEESSLEEVKIKIDLIKEQI